MSAAWAIVETAARVLVALGVMLGAGLVLALLLRLAVSISGLSNLDPAISTWVFTYQDTQLEGWARIITGLLSDWVVVITVAVAAYFTLGLSAAIGIAIPLGGPTSSISSPPISSPS